MTEIIVQALEITGQRGIINKGWGGLGNRKHFFHCSLFSCFENFGSKKKYSQEVSIINSSTCWPLGWHEILTLMVSFQFYALIILHNLMSPTYIFLRT